MAVKICPFPLTLHVGHTTVQLALPVNQVIFICRLLPVRQWPQRTFWDCWRTIVYKADALSVIKPTVSKYWRGKIGNIGWCLMV